MTQNAPAQRHALAIRFPLGLESLSILGRGGTSVKERGIARREMDSGVQPSFHPT